MSVIPPISTTSDARYRRRYCVRYLADIVSKILINSNNLLYYDYLFN